MTITNKQWQDDVALHRYQMIAPLLAEDLSIENKKFADHGRGI